MAIWNERIKKKRLEIGITLAQVAEQLNVTEATAQRYESGNIKNVPYEHMCTYAKIFNCPPQYLMGWADEYGGASKNNILFALANFDVSNLDHRITDAIQGLQTLDEADKCKIYEHINDLLGHSKYLHNAPLLNAAHREPTVTATKELIKAEEEIMDDENF